MSNFSKSDVGRSIGGHLKKAKSRAGTTPPTKIFYYSDLPERPHAEQTASDWRFDCRNFSFRRSRRPPGDVSKTLGSPKVPLGVDLRFRRQELFSPRPVGGKLRLASLTGNSLGKNRPFDIVKRETEPVYCREAPRSVGESTARSPSGGRRTVKTQYFYAKIAGDIDSFFDTSVYPKYHPSGSKGGVNKKVNDEACGKHILEFVGLRSKLYSYKMDSNQHKNAKV